MYRFDDPYARQIAADLVSIGAIKLSPEKPFTWASGWKSPIYCDNRLSLSFPEIRKAVSHHLAAIVRTKYGSADMIAGVATAGIPQGVLVADLLNLPFIYVRSSSKAHGLGNQIEGLQQPSAKVVLIEDLISTGGSSLQAATAIRQAGMEVLGMAAIFTYGFDVATQISKTTRCRCGTSATI